MSTIAYVIAGSEATGGAGLQADLKTFERLGVYGVGTITCIVSFDPKAEWGHRFVPIDSSVIADQIEVATAAHDLDVVKIGMLGTPATVATVAESLRLQPWRHVVVDPVLLHVALHHEASHVLKDFAKHILLHLVNPLQADRAVTW